jgi:transcriptional regulator with XRE-family HTH domain
LTAIQRIRELIDSKVFTKSKLATTLGISRQTLDNYLDGITSPTEKDLTEMSRILDDQLSTISNHIERGVPKQGFSGLILSQRNLDVLVSTLEKAVDALSRDNDRLLTIVDNLIISSNKN